MPKGVTICHCDQDYGPATKVLPAAKDLKGQDVDILFCDDDKIYDRGWHARFKSEAAKKPNTCIIEVGETFPDISDDFRTYPMIAAHPTGSHAAVGNTKTLYTE